MEQPQQESFDPNFERIVFKDVPLQDQKTEVHEKPYSAEQRFHQERWAAEAAARERAFGFGRTKTAEDIMRTEALRDKADFERRKHKELEAQQRNLKIVFNNFVEKARNPEDKSIRTLVLILGGAMKSAYSAGQVIGLNELGLTAEKIDMVVGASGGAVAATAYVGGPEQTLRSTAMMTGPMSTKEFIDPSVKRVRSGDMINLPMLKELLDQPGGKYALDEEKIRQSSTELWYVMTEPVKNGEDPVVRFIDAKQLPSLSDGINASMTIPYLTGPIPKIDGVEYNDGAFSPLPIREVIKQFDPTDILILPQTPFEPMEDIKPSVGDYALAAVARATRQQSLEKGLLSRAKLRNELESFKELGVNIGVLWPPDAGIDRLETDGGKLTTAVLDSARDTIKQFGGEQPARIPLLNLPAQE